MRTRPLGSAALAGAALAIATAVLLVGCTSGPSSTSTSSPSASATPAISPALDTAMHSVTQEGLAIALASNVLQSNLGLVERVFGGSKKCVALPQGGSSRAVSIVDISDSITKATVDTYYGKDCTGLYMSQKARMVGAGESITSAATTTYVGKSGTTLGTLVTKAQAQIKGSGIELSGTGTFTAASGGTTASLGLACQPDGKVMHCQGGVAQDFAALGHSLGSITPLTLHAGVETRKTFAFGGTGRSTSTAALGALSITAKNHKLVLTGAAPTASTAVTTGKAGGFVLFPGTPTGWTITDQTGGVVFTIAVNDNTSRTLTATVNQISTGTVLATAQLDQSGTGTITYKGQKPAAVVSWIVTQ